MTSNDPSQVRRPRGIYLLPNLFTTGGLFAGFYAIIAASEGNFVTASIAVFVAALLDGLDGRVARLTNTQSEFGTQYDSLADLVSFGMAPALVMYHWALVELRLESNLWGKVGWGAAFLYAACAALRLARFNTQVGVVDKRWFIGLASPAAAGLMMALVWTVEEHGYAAGQRPYLALGVTLLAAALMVSRVRFYSFKTLPIRDRVPFIVIPLALLVFFALAVDTARVLLAFGVIYAASGPVAWLLGKLRGARRRPPTDGSDSA